MTLPLLLPPNQPWAGNKQCVQGVESYRGGAQGQEAEVTGVIKRRALSVLQICPSPSKRKILLTTGSTKRFLSCIIPQEGEKPNGSLEKDWKEKKTRKKERK